MVDSYLENAMDYVQETFESANEWMKENDPLRFPEVAASCISVAIGDGPYANNDPGCISSGSGGGNVGASASSSYSGGGSDSFSSSSNGNSIGSGNYFMGTLEQDRDVYKSIVTSPEPLVFPEVKFESMFDHMDNMNGMPIPIPEQGNQNSNSKNTGGDAQGGGNSENSDVKDNDDVDYVKKTFGPKTSDFLGEWLTKNLGYTKVQGENKEGKQQEKKQCVTTNQILVFANAAYYNEQRVEEKILPAGNEQESKVFKTYEDKRLASKASVIVTKSGVPSFNIAGTANPTEEGLENFMKDALNDILIETNSLQGILKDRVDWYISRVEEYNKATGNKEPLILNGHSSGGIEALIVAGLRPDLVSQVNMVDSPGGYGIILKIMNADFKKADEVYKKVEVYNGNRNFVNSKGSHPAGKVIHHILADSHPIIEIIDKFRLKGDSLMLGSCHIDRLCSYKNGEYTVERLTDNVAKKDVAGYFGLPKGQIEAIDNKALSTEDLKKFENRASSKFKFKVNHGRSQEKQCAN